MSIKQSELPDGIAEIFNGDISNLEVQLRRKCSKCKGTGTLPNPIYECFREKYVDPFNPVGRYGLLPSSRAAEIEKNQKEQFMKENNYKEMPVAMFICPMCKGGYNDAGYMPLTELAELCRSYLNFKDKEKKKVK